jgi:murein DD-endopeptidase MepM/ murein hydrolase activator NlpD
METPSAGQVNASATIGRDGLVNGPAMLVVDANRKVFYGLRTVNSRVTRSLEVRLDPPRVAVVSIHHFINLGGAEFVVLKATPMMSRPVCRSAIRVIASIRDRRSALPIRRSGRLLRASPRSGCQRAHRRYARDAAGNEVTTPLEHQPFVKKFVQSKIPIDQKFLDRVVPAIASHTARVEDRHRLTDGLLKGFLEINGNLRKKNGDFIASLAEKSEPRMLWTEAFAQMSNSQVESRFADRRTYYFGDREIDKQVHLGFDLATVQQAPVHAANAGKVVFADFLGIYGNCVIIDHGPRCAVALCAHVDNRRHGG